MTRQRIPHDEWVKRVDQDNKQFVGKGSILILHEKHGDKFYSIPTLEALYAAALATLSERLEEGWFYEPEQPEIKNEFTPEEIEKIKKSSYGETFVKQYDEHHAGLKQYKEDLEDWNTINQAIKTEDGRTAWQVMRWHKSYEYEDWNVETAIDATENPLNKEKIEL